MNTLPTVCCVIVQDKNSRILLIKRGKEPFINKWSLIGGVGYAKKGKTPEEGVIDEVTGDIVAMPIHIKKLFSIDNDSQKVIVFSAQVDSGEAIPVPPHAPELKWCTTDEIRNFNNLAFEHEEILERYLSARDPSFLIQKIC